MHAEKCREVEKGRDSDGKISNKEEKREYEMELNAAGERGGRSQAERKGKKKQRQGRVIWLEERGKREEVESAQRKKAQRERARERARQIGERERGRVEQTKEKKNDRPRDGLRLVIPISPGVKSSA